MSLNAEQRLAPAPAYSSATGAGGVGSGARTRTMPALATGSHATASTHRPPERSNAEYADELRMMYSASPSKSASAAYERVWGPIEFVRTESAHRAAAA